MTTGRLSVSLLLTYCLQTVLAVMTGATSDVPAQDAGIASASVNSAQRDGGSIGSAAFDTVAAGDALDARCGYAAVGAPGTRRLPPLCSCHSR
ncbi:hypothetical protein [Streptomyces sp. NPDC048295]|uniref:hypothetical protein n=1 Tax=Streptomyces sp. NPDC048295 TaxID=3154617 RepID=UPI00341AD424